jgi:hypothetical protein
MTLAHLCGLSLSNPMLFKLWTILSSLVSFCHKKWLGPVSRLSQRFPLSLQAYDLFLGGLLPLGLQLC